MISLLGIPWDGGSSFMRGPAQAPDRIREAIASPSSNLAMERGDDFAIGTNIADLGNVKGLTDADGPAAVRKISSSVAEALALNRPLLCLGGDHSVSWPILKATAPRFERLTIIQFDAHPDLYPDFEGDPLSHACPFARIVEAFDHVDLVQVGIRTLNATGRQQAERFDVRIHSASSLPSAEELRFDHPVYISLDLDVLDPAFAPGVSHHEPGGLSTRELIGLLHTIDAPIMGADLVELNPDRDPTGVTAMVAAKLTKELGSLLLHSAN